MRTENEQLNEAMAAVHDLSDGSRHDWRKFAHVLAAEVTRLTAELNEALTHKSVWSAQFEKVVKERDQARDLEKNIQRQGQIITDLELENERFRISMDEYRKERDDWKAGSEVEARAADEARAKVAALKARMEWKDTIIERALLLTMDGDCDECGYDSDDETDTHAVNCDALFLQQEWERSKAALSSELRGETGEKIHEE